MQQQRQGLEVRACHCWVGSKAAQQGVDPDLDCLAVLVEQGPAVLGGALLPLGHKRAASGLGAGFCGLCFELL